MKLSKAKVAALLPGERTMEHGIVAERTAAGDLRWSVAVMVDGRRIARVIGKESEGVTRSQAESAIEALRTRAREDRLDLPKGRKNHQTFKDVAAEYLARMEATGGRNLDAKKRHLGRTLIPTFGRSRADGISTLMVERYVAKRLIDGVSQATVNRELATLSHVLRRAHKWGFIKADALPDIVKGAEPRKAIVVLTEADADSLLRSAITDTDDRLAMFVAFGLNTAMRHSEMTRVRYDQVDVANRRIFVPRAKAGQREQPVTPALLSIIESRRASDPSSEWIFPNRNPRGPHPHRLSMAKSFQRSVIRAGLDPQKVTPHTMRHTAITRLVRAGVDLPTIQRISGHKTLAMVLRYVHIHGVHIDQAISRIETHFPDSITSKLQ